MLSGEQILNYLGNRIIIHPFDPEAIRGATYNLRVGDFVWVHRGSNKPEEQRDILPLAPSRAETGKRFDIPANSVVSLLTKEVLYVDNLIAGLFHSKVDMVTKGFSHVSTTLDPGWIGPLAITMRNQTEHTIPLWRNETFVKVSFFKLARPAFLTWNLKRRPPNSPHKRRCCGG